MALISLMDSSEKVRGWFLASGTFSWIASLTKKGNLLSC